MFGFILWFGIIGSIPLILCSIFLYPKIKANKIISKTKPLLYVLLCLAIYSALALIYLGGIIIGINPDDLSILFIFIMAIFCFLQKKFLPSPKKLWLFLLPYAGISAIYLIYWIRCATIYGICDSLGWMSYALDAMPFGAAFIGLLGMEGIGWIHALTAALPLASAFVGKGIADYFSERSAENKIK